jgi:asparagine synthase (glutamine-hydrolysing)
MCGIAGVLTFGEAPTLTPQEVQDFLRPLRHRGPDYEQVYTFAAHDLNLWLGHSRLSIIDLSAAGNQPMESVTKRSIIVYNGEIYNFQEIRTQLTALGCSFRSHSDTEVILHAYEVWGIQETLQKLDGMFAFALFDKSNRKMFLVRDRFGKKPLYYHFSTVRQQLVFSSDIRSFDSLSEIPKAINLRAVGYFFSELSTPEEDTIWQHIKKVKAGYFIELGSTGSPIVTRYWQLNYTEDCTLPQQAIIEKTDFLLSRAVKKRLVADVNVSALLSGGIDSSLVVAKMSEHSSGKVKTYSVGFKDQSANELPYARTVASKFDTDHTEIIVDESTTSDTLDDLIWEYGEPFADSSMIPTYLMCREIAKTDKVALGGDGGDELFAGYPSYFFAYKYDRVKHLRFLYQPSRLLYKIAPSYHTHLLTELLHYGKKPAHSLLNRHLGFSAQQLRLLNDEPAFFMAAESEHKAIWNTYAKHHSTLINLMSSSMHTRLVNDYLVKVDRASMRASLEMRSPFLDRDLAEFTASLTPHQLFKKTGTKSILKSIARKYFPDDFVYRNKMGFEIPLSNWFHGDFQTRLKDLVLGARQKFLKLNYDYIEKLIRDNVSGKHKNPHIIWALYVFHVWASKR